MRYPKELKKGAVIGVTATSAGYEAEADLAALASGIKHFNRLGYEVLVTDNVYTSYKGRSSDGPTRARQLMDLFENQKVRSIIAACGGDYLVELLPYLDLRGLDADPKWVQGYSDTTGLTFTITTSLDIATIYSYNFSTFGMEQWHRSLEDCVKIMEGNDVIQHSFESYQDGHREKVTGLEGFDLTKKVEWKNICGQKDDKDELIIKGRLLGGCLDVLLNLIGTRYDKTLDFIRRYQEDGILWYLESFDLNSEALVRGLWQLREAGWFEHAAGFVFGRPAMFSSYTDTDYEEAVLSVLGGLGLPIILDADIGHKPPQFAMVNGAMAKIKSLGGKGSIQIERR
jgi:muramoyltetrapeptide carboxypeptidase LdcA involved in peptidoglycan recycling